MIPSVIRELLKENEEIKQFLNNEDDFELLIKILDQKEIERILQEYPEFININKDNQRILERELVIKTINRSISCLTFIKKDRDNKNYNKLKKIKIYIDGLSGKILKILKN